MGMSEYYGTADEEESVATLQRALELGVTFLDTAADYGLGHNERLGVETIDLYYQHRVDPTFP
jgi:aryl-alcohol dehydrogenase-like predicted oxidoreductase